MDDTHEESPFVPFADLLVGLLFIVLMMIVLLALEVRPEVKIPSNSAVPEVQGTAISTSQKALQDAEAKLAAALQESSSLQRKITAQAGQLSEQQVRSSVQGQQLENSQSQIEALNTDKTRLQVTIDLQSQQIRDGQSQISDLTDDSQQYQYSNKLLAAENQVLRNQIDQLNQQVLQIKQGQTSTSNPGDLNSHLIYDRPSRSGRILNKLYPLQPHELLGEPCVSGRLWRHINTGSVEGWIDAGSRC